jgi:integrase
VIKVRKRGGRYVADRFVDNVRVRGALGTRRLGEAERFAKLIEEAIADGPKSALWSELQDKIPALTLSRFARISGATLKRAPKWEELKSAFTIHVEQRVALGKMARSTAQRYDVTLREFGTFLEEAGIAELRDINRAAVERFKVWRITRVKEKKYSRGATSIALDTAILHRVFTFGLENEMVLKNPVKMEGRPGENPDGGAEPFSAEEIAKLRLSVGPDLLAFLLLRWTGLRGGDAVNITWGEIHFDRREIERVTQKRKKRVILPLPCELLFTLEAEFSRRRPVLSAPVLLNPTTGQTMTRPGLYRRMLALGKRAGVQNAHPHRFRDTLAVDILLRGGTPYDVAKVLGDTIETVEKHYTPFVTELRERVRHLLETAVGMEERCNSAADDMRSKPN